ncbi:hypothetical protein GW17_00023421 [Ensete ventricosum]|nr:hypothetical protein GW17_00023421 [Ensete ventricosum]
MMHLPSNPRYIGSKIDGCGSGFCSASPPWLLWREKYYFFFFPVTFRTRDIYPAVDNSHDVGPAVGGLCRQVTPGRRTRTGDVIMGHVDGRDKIKENVGPVKRIKGGAAPRRISEARKPSDRSVRVATIFAPGSTTTRRSPGPPPARRGRHVSSWFERLRVGWAPWLPPSAPSAAPHLKPHHPLQPTPHVGPAGDSDRSRKGQGGKPDTAKGGNLRREAAGARVGNGPASSVRQGTRVGQHRVKRPVRERYLLRPRGDRSGRWGPHRIRRMATSHERTCEPGPLDEKERSDGPPRDAGVEWEIWTVGWVGQVTKPKGKRMGQQKEATEANHKRAVAKRKEGGRDKEEEEAEIYLEKISASTSF